MVRFCIITVTFNAAACIVKTMQSVFAQDYAGVDYIVVDGGSQDGTADILKRHSARLARWVSEPDHGIYDGMNKGIRMAQELSLADGIDRYVLMLNADDVLYAQDTLSQVASFLNDKVAAATSLPDVLCGSWMIHPEHGAYLQHPGDLTQLPRRYVICHQATFVKASVLAANPFDLQYRLAGDYEQLSRLYISGYKFATCPDVVVCDMILNEGATERNWRASVKEGFAIARARGQYRTGQEAWLLFRKGCVRTIKRLLPKRLSNAFFGWLARHYKAM